MLTSFFAPKPKTDLPTAAAKSQAENVIEAQPSGAAAAPDHLKEQGQGAEPKKQPGVQTQGTIPRSPPEQKRARSRIPASPPGKQKGSPTKKSSSSSKAAGPKGGSQFMENFLKRPVASMAQTHGQLPLPTVQKKHATDASIR